MRNKNVQDFFNGRNEELWKVLMFEYDFLYSKAHIGSLIECLSWMCAAYE